MPDNLAERLVRRKAPATRYGQGRIIFWNSESHANIVSWNGVRLVNLPVVTSAGLDNLNLDPGDSVALLGWDSGGDRGATVWFILGKLVVPEEEPPEIPDF